MILDTLKKSLLAISILLLALVIRIYDPTFIQLVRSWTFDSYQRLEPREHLDLPVRVIDIDDRTLEALGQWPWSRDRVGELIDKLNEQYVAVIGFDFVFAEPDNSSPSAFVKRYGQDSLNENLRTTILKLPDPDNVLAETLNQSNVVLGYVLTSDESPNKVIRKGGYAFGGDDPALFLPDYSGAVTNLPNLEANTAGLGSINMAAEMDTIVRRVPLLLQHKGKIYPSLSLETLRLAVGSSGILARSSGASGEESFGEQTGIVSLKVGPLEIPTDPDGSLNLHYSGQSEKRTISALDLFTEGYSNPDLEGAIVLIGTSAAGLKDIRATPLNPFEAGVQVHAEALEQILSERFLSRPDWLVGAEIISILLFGLLFLFLVPKFGARYGILATVIAIAGAFTFSWNSFLNSGLLVDPLYPSLTILLIYIIESYRQHLATDRQKQEIRSAFGMYLAPDLVEQISEKPEELKLGGEDKPLTVLFSDVQGFTSISEKLNPEELTSLINSFLTPMTDSVLKHGGTIDKYIGDALMAFWNAPVDRPDHARCACLTALEMRDILAELSAKNITAASGGDPIVLKAGIGINTGNCCVGNFGSTQRFNYSALGDAVNISARLEGQTRQYKVDILAGSETVEQASDLAFLQLDKLRVKGKVVPLDIFVLLGNDEVAQRKDFKQLKTRHDKFWAAYLAQEWDTLFAIHDEIKDLAKAFDLTAYYEVMHLRATDYAKQPHMKDWDGVYVATTK